MDRTKLQMTSAASQPGPLTAGAEYPAGPAWEAFFSACWTTYDELMRRRAARQAEQSNDAQHAPIPNGAKP